MTIIGQSGKAKPAAVIVAMDRQEKGLGELSAIQEVEHDFGIPVLSIVTLSDLLAYARSSSNISGHARDIEIYHQKYGV